MQRRNAVPVLAELRFHLEPELVQRAAEQIGKEARSVGCQQGLAPVLDVSRDVRWGRTEETFGEDPCWWG